MCIAAQLLCIYVKMKQLRSNGLVFELNFYLWFSFRLKALSPQVLNLDSETPDEILYGRAGYLYSLLFVNKHIKSTHIDTTLIRNVSTYDADKIVMSILLSLLVARRQLTTRGSFINFLRSLGVHQWTLLLLPPATTSSSISGSLNRSSALSLS